MGRKRKGLPLHGWVLIDKPLGMTSNGVVGAVRRLTGAAKVGHAGTLDPLATGLLPIALGEATKTVSYVMDGAKVYRFVVRWGEATATDDAEGEVIKTSDVRPGQGDIENALKDFIGEIEQVPPAFSAIKVDGKRAYALARQGKPVSLAPRRVRVDDFNLIAIPDADHAEFEIRSGKGTYVRSLARDLAQRLGTYGHISALRRTKVGPFDESMAISLEKLKSLGHSAPPEDWLMPVATALDDIPALALTDAEANRLRHGQPVAALPVAQRSPSGKVEQGTVYCAMAGDTPVALARIAGGEIRSLRVLNL